MIHWSWYDYKTKSWIKLTADNSDKIEDEYQKYKKGDKIPKVAYYCFGDGGKTHIDFKYMETYCATPHVLANQVDLGLPDDYLAFKLRRTAVP